MGKRSKQRQGAGGKQRQGAGKKPPKGSSVPLVGLAGACGVVAMLYKPLLSLLPGPQSTVEVCDFGPDANYKTIEQLVQRSTPCVVRGLEPDLHATMVGQMSPVVLKALPESELFLRVSEGDSHSRILQHSNRSPKENNMYDDTLKLAWPTSPYDGWMFKKSTVKQLLDPEHDYSASLVMDVSDFIACR